MYTCICIYIYIYICISEAWIAQVPAEEAEVRGSCDAARVPKDYCASTDSRPRRMSAERRRSRQISHQMRSRTSRQMSTDEVTPDVTSEDVGREPSLLSGADDRCGLPSHAPVRGCISV